MNRVSGEHHFLIPHSSILSSLVDLLGLAAAVTWIVVVGASYAAIFLFPGPADAWSRAPAPPDLSPAYLPLLAATLILGIIRRWSGRGRRQRREWNDEPSPAAPPP